MNRVNWTVVVVVSVIALLALVLGASLIGNRGYGSWGMMGPGMMDGRWGFAPFGWIGMIFMWLIPLGILVLTVLGIVWLVKAIGGGNNPVAPTQTCSSCGRGVQADWKNCPYCGASLPG
jgi:uncharacterized membrane protein